MSDNLLIAYASRCGSTAEVAEAIAEELRTTGAIANAHPIPEIKDVRPYTAVIVGSAIRFGKWLPEAVEFVKRHQADLNEVPVAYFTVCLTLHEDTPANRGIVADYVTPVRDIVEPVANGLFAGCMNYKRLSFPVRLLAKRMEAPEGDFRDWEAIRRWARGLRALLVGAKSF